jgi:hypothetical protein
VGWLCLAIGLLWMLSGTLDYSYYGAARPGLVPFPVAMAGISNWLWVLAVGLLGTYILLLFPDGKLPSRRWRPLAWLSGAVGEPREGAQTLRAGGSRLADSRGVYRAPAAALVHARLVLSLVLRSGVPAGRSASRSSGSRSLPR